MTVMRIRTIFATAFAIGAASPARAQSANDSTRCTSGRWLPPRPLRTHEGYTITAPRASVVPVDGKTFVAAWPLLTNDSVGKAVYPLAPGLARSNAADQVPMGAIADSEGQARLVPSPRELAAFAMHFEAATDEAGVVHALFASHDSAPANSMIVARSLWYTRYEREKWSAPERILTTDGKVMFTPSMRSPIVTRGRTLHAVAAMQGEGLRYLRREKDVWTNRHIDISPALMGYPRVAVLSTGRIVLIVQAGVDHPLTSSMSSVDAAWSDDDGVSWTPPRRVSHPFEEPVYDFQLFSDERDVLYAFWYQQTDGAGNPALELAFGGSPGRVHVARSADGGVSWHHFDPSALLPNATDLQVVLLPDHSALAALADPRDEQMISMTWSSAWSAPRLLPARPQPFNPSLGLGGAQRPVLVWGITRRPDWTMTMMTTYVPCR